MRKKIMSKYRERKEAQKARTTAVSNPHRKILQPKSINQENYIYNLPGTYTASVTVTDNLGAQSSAFVDVVVQNRNPFARITYDILTVKAPNSLSFSGT